MAERRPDNSRREFPPELQHYNPADGWADGKEWWNERLEYAREHGVYGRTASGKGRILPLLQQMVRRIEDEQRND